MGQPVAVEQKTGGTAAIVRFETNRTLTGMGHERFTAMAQAKGDRPAAVIARRLFESGQVSWVHVYSNIVTVELAPGASQIGLDDILRDLYQYWKPGMIPPTLEDLLAKMPPEATPAPDAGGGEVVAGGDPRIPAHLAARSQAARLRLTGK